MKKEVKPKDDWVGDDPYYTEPIFPEDEEYEDEPEVLPEFKHKSRLKLVTDTMKRTTLKKRAFKDVKAKKKD